MQNNPMPQNGMSEGIVSGAQNISAEVKHVARDVVGEAKKMADALRQTSRRLRTEDRTITEYVEKAARSVDKVSEYLRTHTLSQLIRDVDGYARREPAVFLGGSFVAGLLSGRFFKAASPARANDLDQYQSRQEPMNEYPNRQHQGPPKKPSTEQWQREQSPSGLYDTSNTMPSEAHNSNAEFATHPTTPTSPESTNEGPSSSGPADGSRR